MGIIGMSLKNFDQYKSCRDVVTLYSITSVSPDSCRPVKSFPVLPLGLCLVVYINIVKETIM